MLLKYVMFEDDTFMLFPVTIKHNTFITEQSKPIISAGWVIIYDIECGKMEVRAYGDSITLNKYSRSEDSEIIKTGIERMF